MAKNQALPDWLPAASILQLVRNHPLGYRGIKLLIGELLRDGELDARAGEIWEGKRLGLNEAWRRRTQVSHDPEVPLDRSIWCASHSWDDDMSNWRWKKNRFLLTQSGSPVKRIFLLNVAFRRTQIQDLLPSSRKGIGGRKIDAAAWAKVGVALIDIANEGYFRSAPAGDALPPRFADPTAFVREISSRTNFAYDETYAAELLTPVYRSYFPRTQRLSNPDIDPDAY